MNNYYIFIWENLFVLKIDIRCNYKNVNSYYICM